MGFLFGSFLHALVDAILVGIGLKVWRITQAEPRQRFMSLVVVLPGVTPILWGILGAEWEWVKIYHGVLFHGERWFRVDLFGVPLIRWSFCILIGFSAVLFFFQELLPILRHLRQARLLKRQAENHGARKLSLESLKIPPLKEFRGLNVYVVPNHWAGISSFYGDPPSIFIEEEVLECLEPEELRAAVAHELAHIGMERRPFMFFLYGFRILGFLNPIVLGGFRFVAHEEECVCDDRAVWMTSVNPLALAGALQKLYAPLEESGSKENGLLEPLSYPNLEATGLKEQLNNRIQRLSLESYSPVAPGYWPEFIVVAIGCLALSFLVSG